MHEQLTLPFPDPPSKRCGHCGHVKPVGEFNKNRSRPDGVQGNCRACQRGINNAWNRAHPERARAYYAAHRDEMVARSTAWNRAHPERRRITTRAYDARNRDKAHAYYEAHKPELIARMQRRREARPGIRTEESRRYRARYPLRHTEIENRRRARKRGTATQPVDYAAILRRDRGVCHICGLPVADNDIHFDHVVPLAKGGPHTDDNIRVSHARCNLRKGGRLP